MTRFWQNIPPTPGPTQDEYILDAHKFGLVEHRWWRLQIGPLTLVVSERAAKVEGRRLRYTPRGQQMVADWLDAHLLTPTIVDAIWGQADVRLHPHTIGDGHGGPAPDMARVTAWKRNDEAIDAELREQPGLVASEGKDWVLAIGLWDKSRKGKRAANYGWHTLAGKPVQPLMFGHGLSHSDYSQLGRWVTSDCCIDGKAALFRDVLRGAHGGDVAALVGGVLPGWRQPGVEES
ncbi:MAG: hypothetical protein KJ995_08245 [Candidatus Omnitrophica bacterium]|nr:hypothetical protein [Candidatus Omnitrophota bacterium]MBU1852377.1 hypothetical protein [Candidatus Omnitrophota bacterium]